MNMTVTSVGHTMAYILLIAGICIRRVEVNISAAKLSRV